MEKGGSAAVAKNHKKERKGPSKSQCNINSRATGKNLTYRRGLHQRVKRPWPDGKGGKKPIAGHLNCRRERGGGKPLPPGPKGLRCWGGVTTSAGKRKKGRGKALLAAKKKVRCLFLPKRMGGPEWGGGGGVYSLGEGKERCLGKTQKEGINLRRKKTPRIFPAKKIKKVRELKIGERGGQFRKIKREKKNESS